MSEHITHIAVYEDLCRLMKDSPDLCDAFKQCLTQQYDSGLLGSGSRGNHIFAVPILEDFKDKWESVKDTPDAQIKMAYALGWLTHRAADRRLKLVFAEAEDDPNPAFTNNGCRIYQDAMSFKKVYGGGSKPCLSPYERLSPATLAYEMNTHNACDSIKVSKTEPLFNRMWQADMISKHLFFDTQDDFDIWLETFIDTFPDLTEDLRAYEKAYNDPDPLLASRYYVTDNFYDDADDIIAYVRAIQQGETPAGELATLVEKAKNQSLYAQVLRQGYFYLKGAGAYFMGEIDKPALQSILDKRIS